MTTTPQPEKKKGGCLRNILIASAAGLIILCVIGTIANQGRGSSTIPRDLVQASSTPAGDAAAAPTDAPVITDDGPTPTEELTPVAMPLPTEEPEPTNTPAPTKTPEPPTATPVPPTPVPPIELSGSGATVEEIEVSVLSRITFTHQGSRNFAVIVYKPDDSKDLLVNVIGNYQGARYMEPGAYTLEIDADGAWTATITAMSLDQAAAGAMDGASDDVRGVFIPTGSRATYSFTHDGTGNFAVILVCDNSRDLLVNEIGAYQGDAVVSFGNAQVCMWDISADGNWSIAPK